MARRRKRSEQKVEKKRATRAACAFPSTFLASCPPFRVNSQKRNGEKQAEFGAISANSPRFKIASNWRTGSPRSRLLFCLGLVPYQEEQHLYGCKLDLSPYQACRNTVPNLFECVRNIHGKSRRPRRAVEPSPCTFLRLKKVFSRDFVSSFRVRGV